MEGREKGDEVNSFRHGEENQESLRKNQISSLLPMPLLVARNGSEMAWWWLVAVAIAAKFIN